jgi:hypothetical protein
LEEGVSFSDVEAGIRDGVAPAPSGIFFRNFRKMLEFLEMIGREGRGKGVGGGSRGGRNPQRCRASAMRKKIRNFGKKLDGKRTREGVGGGRS